ncbi:MAG: hypothetical protein AAGH89_13265 [Verrucomicrobiota bacterium]
MIEKFNKRELTLLGAFLVLVAIAIHTLIAGSLSERSNNLKAEHRELMLQKVDAETLLEERDFWLKQHQWVQANQPQFVSDEEAEKDLLRLAESASAKSLKVNDRELFEIQHHQSQFVEAGMRLQISGTLENLVGWLHQIQDPRQFREVREFTLMPDQTDDTLVSCSLSLFRRYRPPS